MAKLRTFLVSKGWAQPEAAALSRSLACADYSLPVAQASFAHGWSLRPPSGDEGPEGIALPGSDAEGSELAADPPEPEPELVQVLAEHSQKCLLPPPPVHTPTVALFRSLALALAFTRSFPPHTRTCCLAVSAHIDPRPDKHTCTCPCRSCGGAWSDLWQGICARTTSRSTSKHSSRPPTQREQRQ